MPTVEFERTFQAAHRLSGYDGKCARIHGHNFHVRTRITTDLLGSDGFAVEFDRVKQVIDRYDHRLILNTNDRGLLGPPLSDDWIVYVEQDPTTEYMAQHLAEQLAQATADANDCAAYVEVELWLRETDSIMAYAKTPWRR
jgi:6-pyruvoyltetrahydropterin/6-carboxytetrahydropterin synthase